MKQMTHLLLVAALLGMPIQGCKKEGPTESPAQSPAPPVQTAFPTGTFRASDSEGQWVQVYNTDSTFTLTRNGVRMFTQGRYTPSARQVMLSENSQLCSGMGDGTYGWSFSGGQLTFTVITDGCINRRNTLITNSWKKD